MPADTWPTRLKAQTLQFVVAYIAFVSTVCQLSFATAGTGSRASQGQCADCGQEAYGAGQQCSKAR